MKRLLLVLLLAGCATAPVSNGPLPFDEAIARATDDLVAQTQRMPAFLAQLSKHAVVQDPSLDAETGQQTDATVRLDADVDARLRLQYSQFERLPFRATHLAKADALLIGTLHRESTDTLRIALALIDLKSGEVIAQSGALARSDGIAHAPLPYYRDSPVLVKDAVVDAYIRSASTPRGKPADAAYLDRIAVAVQVDEATDLYNQARYREALGEYRSALAVPAGEQLRVLNGVYLSTLRLGMTKEAEAAFARVVAMGIAYKQLSVKFLFAPGGTTFWSDPRITAPYPMWLRQIARETRAAEACLRVVGHTTKTGAAKANEALSLKRAQRIRDALVAEDMMLAARTRAIGMGYRENLIGSGTDDAIDVLDRRVEFRVEDCAR